MAYIIHIFIIIYNAIYVIHYKPYHKNIQSYTCTAKIIIMCTILKLQIFTTINLWATVWTAGYKHKCIMEILQLVAQERSQLQTCTMYGRYRNEKW